METLAIVWLYRANIITGTTKIRLAWLVVVSGRDGSCLLLSACVRPSFHTVHCHLPEFRDWTFSHFYQFNKLLSELRLHCTILNWWEFYRHFISKICMFTSHCCDYSMNDVQLHSVHFITKKFKLSSQNILSTYEIRHAFKQYINYDEV